MARCPSVAEGRHSPARYVALERAHRRNHGRIVTRTKEVISGLGIAFLAGELVPHMPQGINDLLWIHGLFSILRLQRYNIYFKPPNLSVGKMLGYFANRQTICSWSQGARILRSSYFRVTSFMSLFDFSSLVLCLLKGVIIIRICYIIIQTM